MRVSDVLTAPRKKPLDTLDIVDVVVDLVVAIGERDV